MKEPWAKREGVGKAYELGSSLFDTWNRMRQAAEQGDDHLPKAWGTVFHEKRVARIKESLDDLQTRLDPAAVEVVNDHFDRWGECVRHAVAKDAAGLPTGSKALPEIRKQALIWRQLVTRDKEPEAYLQRKDRARVRHEFNRLMWRSPAAAGPGQGGRRAPARPPAGGWRAARCLRPGSCLLLLRSVT
jgi:hypothetical protein